GCSQRQGPGSPHAGVAEEPWRARLDAAHGCPINLTPADSAAKMNATDCNPLQGMSIRPFSFHTGKQPLWENFWLVEGRLQIGTVARAKGCPTYRAAPRPTAPPSLNAPQPISPMTLSALPQSASA